MSRKRFYLAIVGIVLAAVMMFTAVTGCSQDNSQSATDKKAAQDTQVETAGDVSATSNDGTQEGIKVHGHWTIEVLEPDGSVVSHDEFENALLNAGKKYLVDLLARERTAGPFQIFLRNHSNPSQSPFQDSLGDPKSGIIVESSSLVSGTHVFKTLSVTAVGFPTPELVLTGTATAAVDGAIDRVSTQPEYCSNTVAPADCVSATSSGLTETAIAPISVLAGQQILVEVIIEFS